MNKRHICRYVLKKFNYLHRVNVMSIIGAQEGVCGKEPVADMQMDEFTMCRTIVHKIMSTRNVRQREVINISAINK